jgi:ketosteroid isomerase-like protein
MASQNAALLQQMMADYAAGNLDAMYAVINDDAVFVESSELPFGGGYIGAKGFQSMMENMLSQYEMYATDGEVWDAGERVILKVNAHFTSKKTGAKGSTAVAEIYRFANGKIAGADVFYHAPGDIAKLHDVPAS